MLCGIICLFCIIILYWLVLTVGLPITIALVFSTTSRGIFFSWAYHYVLQSFFQSKLVSLRRKMFSLLDKSLSSRKSSSPLEVLEIGIGDGANFAYYPDNCNLTVVEKNKFFEPFLRSNAKKYPHITYKRTVIQSAENMTEVQDDSMDVVVTTLFHCSCKDSDKALQEILRVLKPGGKYICLEHVAFPKNSFGLILQKFVHPLWYLYSNECTLHRDSAKKIKQCGFSEVLCEKYEVPHWWMYIARHWVMAVATK